jgi:hypothetical protein
MLRAESWMEELELLKDEHELTMDADVVSIA